MPLSVSVEDGMPCWAMALRNSLSDDGAGDAAVGGDRERVAGVVVEPAQDLDVGAVGEPPVGEVGLPAFVGLVGGEADVGRLGRFCGAGRPGRRACRWRLIVAARRVRPWWCCEVPGDGVRAGVEAFADKFSRSSMISSIVVCASRVGLVCGRRDRGSNAASPSSR